MIILMKCLGASTGLTESLALISDQRSELDPFRLIDQKVNESYESALRKFFDKCDTMIELFPADIDFNDLMESLARLCKKRVGFFGVGLEAR